MRRSPENRILRLTGVLVCVVVLAFQSAHAQNGSAVLDYMLANRVGFSTASSALGIDGFDVAEELGFTDSLGFLEAQIDTSLLFADCWRLFTFPQGTAVELGLTGSSMTRYFELRAANDLSFVRECRDDEYDSYLLLSLNVWTVGDTFPVAYHIEVTGQIFPTYEGRPSNSVESAWLGYANAANVEGSVREAIATAVEELAFRILKVRRLLDAN